MSHVTSKRLGLIFALFATLAPVATLPFTETPPDTPPGVLAFVRSAEVRIAKARAVPRFAVVQEGSEDPTAQVVAFEGRRPKIEFPSSYRDSDVAAVLEATFPIGRLPLLDPSTDRVRFETWVVQRQAIQVPYRVFLLVSSLCLALGVAVTLWPRETRPLRRN